MANLMCSFYILRISWLRFQIPMSDEVDDLEAKKDPLMMKAVKAFKANYVSPIQFR